MRISDWSSDVCSSDLAFDLGEFERLQPRHAGKLRAIGDRGRRADAGIGTDVAERGVPVAVGLNRGRALGRDDRSEEHTSKLQSLMRISYAVFCLKKKTKIKPTT